MILSKDTNLQLGLIALLIGMGGIVNTALAANSCDDVFYPDACAHRSINNVFYQADGDQFLRLEQAQAIPFKTLIRTQQDAETYVRIPLSSPASGSPAQYCEFRLTGDKEFYVTEEALSCCVDPGKESGIARLTGVEPRSDVGLVSIETSGIVASENEKVFADDVIYNNRDRSVYIEYNDGCSFEIEPGERYTVTIDQEQECCLIVAGLITTPGPLGGSTISQAPTVTSPSPAVTAPPTTTPTPGIAAPTTPTPGIAAPTGGVIAGAAGTGAAGAGAAGVSGLFAGTAGVIAAGVLSGAAIIAVANDDNPAPLSPE